MKNKRYIKKYLDQKRGEIIDNQVCFAPVSAMHFSFNGKVYACHNNNSYAYGDLRIKSLHDIWQSQNRLNMIKQLRKGKLVSVGCSQCFHDIKYANYNSVNALRYEPYGKYNCLKYPSVLGFRFSDVCNIRCRMCLSNQHVRKSLSGQNVVYDDAFFKELEEFIPHAKYAYFLGGEPFYESLNFKVFELFRKLNPDCRIAIQTNGMIFNEEIESILKAGKYDINVSIDSLKPELFSRIRAGASLPKVLDNINKFIAICRSNDTEFSSCFTPMVDNCLELPSVINYYNRVLKSRLWINKYYFPAQYAIWALSANEINSIYERLIEYQPEVSDDISKYNSLQFHDIIQILSHYKMEAIERQTTNKNFAKLVGKQLQNLRKDVKKSLPIDNSCYFEKLEIFNDTPSKQTYFFLKKLLDIFSGDKLVENIIVLEKEFIIRDIEYIKC